MAKILIIDDESAIRSALKKFLRGEGFEVSLAESGKEAIRLLEGEIFDLALVDLVLPDMGGIELIEKMKMIQPDVVPVVITGFGTITSAVQAVKAGAFHYITKPFELDDISSIVSASLQHKALRDENFHLRRQLSPQGKFGGIVGKSEEMQAVFDLVDKVAGTDSTILLLGESGTGKELIARAIHQNSRRKDRTLVTVNCAAIPEGLLESELFGHVKGAYTGAISTVPGRFDNADNGTIFLDEIGDMSFKLQVKLLRVLQEQSFEPVGSTKTHKVDVRVIAATNQDLEKAVKEKRFREDLFYRLNVIPIRIPPLRERKDDIPLLVRHFIDKYNLANACSVEDIDKGAMGVLMKYHWPGNIRELENMVERSAVLKRKGVITITDLPEKVLGVKGSSEISIKHKQSETLSEKGISFRKAVAEYETNLIKQALDKADWNKNKAAQLLDLNRTTLVEKIKKLNLYKD